ncbi:hypothetical protein BD289DRAFT_456995 [Coniella lustricola]|uniref:Uncharacterized protein n=1 Tax=Coniella lustricola TaxID=2025994 RepID=A0A2T2ZTM2_9PEZI|nr:hypothetical protein BD289DRAFT_456995 [Coniella lustricola]
MKAFLSVTTDTAGRCNLSAHNRVSGWGFGTSTMAIAWSSPIVIVQRTERADSTRLVLSELELERRLLGGVGAELTSDTKSASMSQQPPDTTARGARLCTMSFQSEPIFPIIPPPMALAADALLSGTSRRARSPVPPAMASMASMATMATTPTTAPAADHQPRRQSRSTLFNEDIFSRLLSGPLLIVHFALYCAVPVYYLVYWSPFSHFDAGAFNQLVRWALLGLTQYLTAILMVSWSGRHQVRRELVAGSVISTTVLLLAGLKSWIEQTALDKGQG